MSESTAKPLIFVMGHPLLDMQVSGPSAETLLKKYDLQPNDGIRAEAKHMSMYARVIISLRKHIPIFSRLRYEEIARDHPVTYVAGGTANAARAAAVLLFLT